MNTSASTTLRRSCATLLLLLSGLPALADEDAGDPVRGKLQFAPCTSCHIVEATGPVKIGPSLHGLFGAKAAARPDFKYSEALKKSGIVWDERTLDAWLTKPAALVPGNLMAYMGVANEETRANIIAYLKVATR